MLVRLLVAALATWRLSSLILYEGGPFDVFMHVRTFAASGPAPLRILFSCIYCLSMWMGLACAVLMLTDVWIVLLPFALSAGAVMVDRYVPSNR